MFYVCILLAILIYLFSRLLMINIRIASVSLLQIAVSVYLSIQFSWFLRPKLLVVLRFDTYIKSLKNIYKKEHVFSYNNLINYSHRISIYKLDVN